MGIPVSEKLRNGSFDGIRVVDQLKGSEYYQLLLKAYDTLQRGILFRSREHGIDHIERTMLLGAVIAMQQGFTGHETEQLLYACSYHDIGRIDEARDPRHGKRSANRLPEPRNLEITEDEMRCIRATIATHSANDDMIESFMEEYEVPEDCVPWCRRLCKALKDADNLDRVRIDSLNIRYLRFPESRETESDAWEIFRRSRE